MEAGIWVIAFSVIAGITLGAGLVEALHAQGKPQAYVVGEINVTDPEGFAKDFSPLARKALAEAPGYRALVLGGKTVAIEGPAPKTRVVINVFDNLEAAVQAYNSADFKAAKKIDDNTRLSAPMPSKADELPRWYRLLRLGMLQLKKTNIRGALSAPMSALGQKRK